MVSHLARGYALKLSSADIGFIALTFSDYIERQPTVL
jgi:hypothetical protein